MELYILESELAGNSTGKLNANLEEFFRKYRSKDYSAAYHDAVHLYNLETDLNLKSFYLHLICIITEIEYKPELRRNWMNQWPKIISSGKCEFAETALQYHRANTCYFESFYEEACRRYTDLVNSPKANLRFKALAHFHLGLIFSQRQHFRAALAEYTSAREIAVEINHQILMSRINRELDEIKQNEFYFLLNAEVIEYLKLKEFKMAKSLYLKLRREEVVKNINRQQHSLHVFLPIFSLIKNNSVHSMLNLLSLIEDIQLKHQCVSLAKLLGYDFEELNRLNSLYSSDLGINQITEYKFLGYIIKDIQNDDLRNFTKYLLETDFISKEDICKNIWNLNYDPTIHDGKIYKLIHKFRDYFGKKDLLVNLYGKYKVNQKYRVG